MTVSDARFKDKSGRHLKDHICQASRQQAETHYYIIFWVSCLNVKILLPGVVGGRPVGNNAGEPPFCRNPAQCMGEKKTIDKAETHTGRCKAAKAEMVVVSVLGSM